VAKGQRAEVSRNRQTAYKVELTFIDEQRRESMNNDKNQSAKYVTRVDKKPSVESASLRNFNVPHSHPRLPSDGSEPTRQISKF
jgi:hypothetical protein